MQRRRRLDPEHILPPPPGTSGGAAEGVASKSVGVELGIGTHRVVHRVDLGAIRHNYAHVKAAAKAQQCDVIVVVKANAYGHGAIPIALHLAEHCSAKAFAVATLQEGIALRQAFEKSSSIKAGTVNGQDNNNTKLCSTRKRRQDLNADISITLVANRSEQIRIMVLDPPIGAPNCFDNYQRHGIEVMVSGREAAAALLAWTHKKQKTAALAAARRPRLGYNIMIDTGMASYGLDPNQEETVAILELLYQAEKAVAHQVPAIKFFGLHTHMADAECAASQFTFLQTSRFASLLERIRSAEIPVPAISIDNSAALLTTNLTHFSPGELLSRSQGYVRIGHAIYGQCPAFRQELRAVSNLLALVQHVTIVKKGASVGYNRAYVAPTDVRIATLSIGHADGYPQELGNGVGVVAIHGKIFPVIGNVCMDMLMVELGRADDDAGVGTEVKVGDIGVLWGPMTTTTTTCDNDGQSIGDGEGSVRLLDIAATLKMTPSALTCGVDRTRVVREFVDRSEF